MGLYLLGPDFISSLNTGDTLAIFQLVGNIPHLIDKFLM